MSYHNPPTTPRSSASFDDYTLSEIRRAAATGIYDIRGGGAKRKVPHFDDLLFLGASISRYPLEGYRETLRHQRRARHPLRQEADRAEDPDHHRRHELRLALRPGQGGARPRRDARRHLDHHRRRRHDRGGARPLADPRLPVPAVALRHEPDGPAGAPTRSRWWSARAPSRAAAACCSARRSPTASPPCAPCPRASTSARPAGTRTGRARTTWRSRSWSCARSPTGKSRSTSRSAAPAPTTTPRLP